MKKMLNGALLALLPLCTSLVQADATDNEAGSPAKKMKNKHCPVTGKPVNGVDSYTHNGKEYNLCGKGCKSPLSENPEKYTGDSPQNDLECDQK